MADIHDANARDLMRDMPDAGPSEDDIAEALRAAARRAQLDEREACAKVAESYYRKSTFNSRVRSLGQDAADGIASAIRNRTT